MGKISVTLTFVAALGPLLVTVMVKVMASPLSGVESLTVLVVTKSAGAQDNNASRDVKSVSQT